MWSKTTQHFCQTQKKNIASSCNRVTKSTCDIFVRKFARFAIHPVFLAYKKQWFKSRLIGLFWISFIQTRSTAYWPICIFLRWVAQIGTLGDSGFFRLQGTYQCIVKAAASGVFEDLKFKEGSDQNWRCPCLSLPCWLSQFSWDSQQG